MWHPVLWMALVGLLTGYVHGDLASEVAEIMQVCCAQGTKYALDHTSEECSSSMPPDVQPTFGSLCILAMDQCCKEYAQKKSDCDSGIELASTGKCDAKVNSTKSCCDECAKGMSARSRYGESACKSNPKENNADELLAGNAFMACCKKPVTKAVTEKVVTSTSSLFSVLPSLCEEYAPNELCAHHCIPVPGSYKCECNPGFKLMADGRNCIEVVKNRCKPRNPCQHKCNDNGVEVKCSCRRGYELKADKKTCQDIDECVVDPGICLPETQCYNIQGSYRCIPIKKNNSPDLGKCPPGFSRNLKLDACDDIDECSLPHPPCPSYACENTVGGYKCGGVPGDPSKLSAAPIRPVVDDRCPTGFRTGYNDECEDIDECAIAKDDCNHQSQFCINTRGSFYCQDKVSSYCPPGFRINRLTNKCEDYNECEDSEDICRPDQICVNQLGQYDCKPKTALKKIYECPDGMRMKPETGICTDIDECVEGTHLCDQYQNCLNTNGSHECHCKLGYDLDPLTGACVDINECATNQHECVLETQRCDNTVGSYLCIRFTSCGTGYILHHSSGRCEDVDECALGTHNCARAGPEYHCANIPGSFRCVRKRASTTSTTTTTAVPEYEEYYYDSEEDITTEGNAQSGNQTEIKEPAPASSSARPETSSEAPSTSPSTQPTETPPTIPPLVPKKSVKKPDNDDGYKINEIAPKPTIEYQTSTAEPRRPELTTIATTTETPRETIPPEPPTSSKLPEIIFNQPEPEPTYIPRPAESDEPTFYEPQPTKPIQSELPSNESLQPEPNEPVEPQTTYRPVDSTTPRFTPASGVNVSVKEDTATVKAGERHDDPVNKEYVPVIEWRIEGKSKNCQLGFEIDNYGVCNDIDECTTNRHKCSGLTEVCRNTIGGYLCDCRPGFRRDAHTGACDLIPVTRPTTTSTTETPAITTPRNYFWGYPEYRPATVRAFRPRNLCDSGFHLNSQTGLCEDVNECVNGQANCAAVEICVNTLGGYRCECPPNWHLDLIKHRCIPNRTHDQFPTGYGNEPSYGPVENSIPEIFKGHDFMAPEITPLDTGGTIIRCAKGYRVGEDNTCVDIDECATGDAKCGPLQMCHNLPGGYTCSCPSGHKLVGDHQCQDVDECAEGGSVPICSKNADCINTVGSYQCRCHEGFRLAPVNDKVCMDVDECTDNRAGTLCEQRCNNVWGSYRCSCHKGYRLNKDNVTCSDIDECTEFKSKVPCVGRCVNLPGSYRCACPSGYRLSEDKRSCIDIDECDTGEAPCAGSSQIGSGTSDICLNTRGSYRCQKIVCPSGYRLESKNRCTKVERICSLSDWECAHQPSTYSYNFITFVSKLYIPASKVDLFTMRGPTWPHAITRFQLRLVDVNAPPIVKTKADINCFLLVDTGKQGVVSLVKSLEGPQSIELELTMELYNDSQFGGIAVAKIFIFVSEFEF